MPPRLPGSAFWPWADACVAALGAAREEIDALNVYPVADSDTGTNLYLTFEAALAAARAVPPDSPEVLRAFVDGALRGARGNSGVIMSSLLRAAARVLLSEDSVDREPSPLVIATALTEAAAAAWQAVGDPVEGTMLSVARSAAEAAQEKAADGRGIDEVVSAAAAAAQEALARTPAQLEVLRRSGVVDAGGRGLCVVLDTSVRLLTGRWAPTAANAERGRHRIARPIPTVLRHDPAPAYEVMYLLDAEDAAVASLRKRLSQLGDSVVVVGGDGLWNVHVHGGDAGAILEAGLAAGQPYRITVATLDQAARQQGPVRRGRRVVCWAAGVGLHKLFSDAGAYVVSAGGQRCSTGDFLEAVTATGADEVVVLPNDRARVAMAEAAAAQARGTGIRVAVIPTSAQVQALAALAVHEPGRGFDDDVVAMTTAAGHTRHGAVTVAERSAMTSAGPCQGGDVLGVVNGDFAIVGGSLAGVAVQIVERLLTPGGELVTLVSGVDAPPELAEEVSRSVRAGRSDIEPVVYDGRQQRYPLLIAVE